MKPLNLIYWIKLGLGASAAAICMALRVSNIFDGILLCIAVFVISNAILRLFFAAKVNKPSAIIKTGISVYFLAWIFFWIFLYTLFPY